MKVVLVLFSILALGYSYVVQYKDVKFKYMCPSAYGNWYAAVVVCRKQCSLFKCNPLEISDHYHTECRGLYCEEKGVYKGDDQMQVALRIQHNCTKNGGDEVYWTELYNPQESPDLVVDLSL